MGGYVDVCHVPRQYLACAPQEIWKRGVRVKPELGREGTYPGELAEPLSSDDVLACPIALAGIISRIR